MRNFNHVLSRKDSELSSSLYLLFVLPSYFLSVLVVIVFQGFCGWSLVVYDRLLIPSNPANGVLRYKDNYYAFCNKEAAYEFVNAPDRYELQASHT